MFDITVKSFNEDKIREYHEKCHLAMVGSKAYIDCENVLSDINGTGEAFTFPLIIGMESSDNMKLTIDLDSSTIKVEE